MHCQVYGSSKSALTSIDCTLAMKNPDIHDVMLCPGRNATRLNPNAGTIDPKDGSMIIIGCALEGKGKSPAGFYYNAQGELP